MPNSKIKSKLKKLSDYNKAMIDYNKYLIIGIFFIIVIPIILIIWCSIILNYLLKINLCDCYNKENKSNYSNIQYLIVIESIIIVLSIFFILFFSYNLFLNNKSGGGMSNNPLKYIMTLLYILISGFFLYYVYKFSENVNVNCSCTQSWIRYLLYIQSFFMLITIFGNLIILLLSHFIIL